jgi:hypothetical protein
MPTMRAPLNRAQIVAVGSANMLKIYFEQVTRMRIVDSLIIGAALVGLSSAACGVPTATECPRAIGVFKGRYSYVSGTCEPSLTGRALLLESDDPGNTVRKVNNLSDVVITEINLIGCTIGMKQDITDTQGTRKISSLSGDLMVHDASELVGQIQRQEYMPDGTTLRCSGMYNATYTRDGAVLGGAAERALQ